MIRRAAADRPRALVILQPPITVEKAERAARDAAAAVTKSARWAALAGDLGLGHDARAVVHLRRAAELGADPDLFAYDESRSGARGLARRRLRPFTDWLAAETAHARLTPGEANALRATAMLIVAD